MRSLLGKAYTWLTSQNFITWIGHGLLGAAIAAVGFAAGVGAVGVSYAVLAAFLYRELSDLLAWYLDENPVWDGPAPVRRGHKAPLQAKLKDGALDLWAPLVGAALVGLLLGP